MALHKDLVDYFTKERNDLLNDSILNIIYGAGDQKEEYLSAAREVAAANGIAEAFETAWASYLERKQRGESTSKDRSDKEIEQIIGGSILKAVPTEKRGKEPITIESLAEEYAALGITVRLNEITHDIEIESSNPNILDHDSLIATTHSYLKGARSFYTGVTLDNLNVYTAEIAKRNRFNPVLDYLYGIQYDGNDHFEALYDLMGIDSDDSISRALIRKWFYQGIVLLHNSNAKHVAAEGVLTLVGPQGCGKTSLIEKFAIKSEWFARGATLNPNDKDTIRRCCSRWIIELGEVETTLRSDIEALKNFITNDMDVYRVPYGRSDLKYARRSNLAATCNSDRYLLDQTGNRRWWTVPISKTISHSDIEIFPIEQLHAQALAYVRIHGKNCFRLSPWEYDALNSRNQKALKPIKAEDEIHDILTAAELYPDDYKFVDITPTDWKGYHDGIKHYSSEIIGRALKKLGVRQKSNGAKRLYSLPVWKDAATIYQRKPKAKDEKSAG